MQQLTDNVLAQLDVVVKSGMNILEIDMPTMLRFFIYDSWEAAYRGSSTSVSFNTFRGIEITPFINVTRDVMNSKIYLQQIAAYLQNREAMNVKFAESIPYFLFSM